MSENLILTEIRSSTRDGALEELVDHLIENTTRQLPKQEVLNRLLERERMASTAVGFGVAIPHARLPDLDTAVVCLGRSTVGIDFVSVDGQPTHLFLTILAPEKNSSLHLKVLARASRLLTDREFRQAMMQASNRSELWQTLSAQDRRLSG